MKFRFQTPAVALAVAAALCSVNAQARSFLDAVIDTTPAGLVSEENRQSGLSGFWNDSVEGSKKIMKEGRSLWIVPTYTNHPNWAWDNRHDQNGWPMGMGLGRQYIDDRGNERSFFIVNFVDSNYRIEPTFGYQWVARFPIAQTGMHIGAGYLAGFTFRGDYMWAPIPMPLPVASIGTDKTSVYMAWIPKQNVFFFYTTLAIDDAAQRELPLPAASAWSKTENFVYGGIGWEYQDNGEEYSPNTVKNDDSWHVGMRHYSGRHWATDISYRQSAHDIRSGSDYQYKRYRFKCAAIQLQYNIDVFDSFRLYGGAGVGYSKMSGPAGSDKSLHPVFSLGATYALTDHIFVNADVFTSLARYKNTVEGRTGGYVYKGMPTDFTVSLGFAF